MEGRVVEGQEEFSQVVKVWVSESSSPAPQEYEKLLGLYISLLCGDTKMPRTIPFDLAHSVGLFQQAVSKVRQQAEEKARREKEESLKRKWDEYNAILWNNQKFRLYAQRGKLGEIKQYLMHWRWGYQEGRYIWGRGNLCINSILYHHYPELQTLLNPYLTARFAPLWKPFLSNADDPLRPFADDSTNLKRKKGSWFSNKFSNKSEDFTWVDDGILVKDSIIAGLKLLFQRFGEGAYVVFSLLDCRVKSASMSYRLLPEVAEGYNSYSMLHFPMIEGKDPLQIFLLIKKMKDILLAKDLYHDCLAYFKFNDTSIHKGFYSEAPLTTNDYYEWLVRHGFRITVTRLKSLDKRADVQKLIHKMQQTYILHLYFQHSPKLSWWKNLDEDVQLYLLARVCDIAQYGNEVAARTFPQPTIPGVAKDKVSSLVSLLVTLMTDMLTEEEKQIEKKEQEQYLSSYIAAEWCSDREKWVQQQLDKQFSNKLVPISAPDLEQRVLTNNEIEVLKEACRSELLRGGDEWWNPQKTLALINEFIKFCILLRKPENHIQVPSMQYVEKQVNSRTIKDMVDEMAQELTDLPPKIAYAKFIKEKGEERLVIKHKFKTFQPPKVLITGLTSRLMRAFIEDKTLDAGMVKERVQIEEEIRLRQEKWRSQTPESTRRIPPSQDPPPSSY